MMKTNNYKGITPSVIIAHSLKTSNRTQQDLAKELNVKKQLVSAIITGKREIPEPLTFKLDKALGYETGFFLMAQANFKIKQYKEKQKAEIMKTENEMTKVRFLVLVLRQYSNHIGKTIPETTSLFEKYGADKFLYNFNETMGSLTPEHRNEELDTYFRNRCHENH